MTYIPDKDAKSIKLEGVEPVCLHTAYKYTYLSSH
jgi:hypothetical protein